MGGASARQSGREVSGVCGRTSSFEGLLLGCECCLLPQVGERYQELALPCIPSVIGQLPAVLGKLVILNRRSHGGMLAPEGCASLFNIAQSTAYCFRLR